MVSCYVCVSSRKYPYPPSPAERTANSNPEGLKRPKTLKESIVYAVKMGFPEGEGVSQGKSLPWGGGGGMDTVIFSGTTQ